MAEPQPEPPSDNKNTALAPCDRCREHVIPIVDTWRGRDGAEYTDLLCPHCGLVL